MAIAPSPTDSPLDEEERALLDSFNQGIAPRQELDLETAQFLHKAPGPGDVGTEANLHQSSTGPGQTVAEPVEAESAIDAGDDPFAALKNGGDNRGTIDLPGPRASYRVEETSHGSFTVEHLASGEEVRMSGVDYLRFSDLQLHSEFLTRTNPPAAPQAAAQSASVPSASAPPTSEDTTAEDTAAKDTAAGDTAAADTTTVDVTSVDTTAADSFTVAGNGSDEGPSAANAQPETSEADCDSGFTAGEDGSITFSAQDLLGGTAGSSGQGMSVVAVTGSVNGTLVDNGDDSWTFTPDRDFDGSVELEVTISDGQGVIETATATIEITPSTNSPEAEIQIEAAIEDGGIAAGSVVVPATEGGAMTYSLVSGPVEGTVTVNADGSYSFDPGSDFEDLGVGEVRNVSFIYHASDGQGASDSGIVTITVTGSNDGPVASDQTLPAPETSVLAPADLLSGPAEFADHDRAHGGEGDNGNAGAQEIDSGDGETNDNLAPVGAGTDVISGEAGPGLLDGPGEAQSIGDRASVQPAVPTDRATSGDAAGLAGGLDVPPAAGPSYPHSPDLRVDDARGADAGEGDAIRTDQDDSMPKGDSGNDRTDPSNPSDTIDLSKARNWTVTYDNGDSFTANDSRDDSLFTDTSGTIDFGNGDRVNFDNVRRFNW